LKCDEPKAIVLKSEFYDDAHNLIDVVVGNPPMELSITEGTPLATLQRILCGLSEVHK